MASTNLFDLLADDDNDDPSQLIAAQQQKIAAAPKKSPAAAAAAAQPAKLPSKPLPPSQAVRESKNDAPRAGGRGGGPGGRGGGRGRGGGGFNRERDTTNSESTFRNDNGFGGYKPSDERDTGKSFERRGGYGGPRSGFRGGHRGGFDNGEVAEGERVRRPYERRSGTGRGNEVKRDGAGRGNWGAPTDEVAPETEEPATENEKIVDAEKPDLGKQSGEEDAEDVKKENPEKEPEEKEPEEMTLDEYEKVLEEKRKALLALKTEERKVSIDKELKSMQLLSSKKSEEEIFVKLGSDKDKRKDAAEKEERAKKSVSINEFLKPAESERHNGSGGRRGGRGRGSRGGFSGGGGNMSYNVAAPKIDDVGQFPSLAAK